MFFISSLQKTTSSIMDFLLKWIALIILPIFAPLYLVFKLLCCLKRSIFSENIPGKVVLITGASSGIGEYLAYEYARRGARLALAARREDRLQAVAKTARNLGSPDVITVSADVSRIEDCKKIVDETVNHFGKLDILINNAGIARTSVLEDRNYVSDAAFLMDVNFWGSVHCCHHAIPHLKRSKGKIIGITSMASWVPGPRVIFYNASKAALASFYETLRIECGSQIGITIVAPGIIQSELTNTEFMSQFGMQSFPAESTEVCAKAIVGAACRGDYYLIVPSSFSIAYWIKILYPELIEWLLGWFTGKQNFNKKA